MRSADAELYKDKIEISLDGRQVFYLFFGGAVVACLVFVLGVMVGRRVEARAHLDRGAATSAARDPLAALDQLDATAKEDLSFRRTLTGEATTTEVEDAIAAIEKARTAKPVTGEGKAGAADKAAAEAKPTVVAADDEDPPSVDKKPAAAPAKPAPVADKKPDAPKPEAKPDPKAEAKAADAGRFTLQLSSFKDKAEAESFQADLKAAGYRTYLVQADVPGKGTFFRVRLGKYDSYQAALDAKGDFERKVQKIAYVTRL